jgi:hypothetical protein
MEQALRRLSEKRFGGGCSGSRIPVAVSCQRPPSLAQENLPSQSPEQGACLGFGHMKRVSDKASHERALQSGPTKQSPDHGHWYILRRRSGVDLHKVTEGQSYLSITIRQRRGGQLAPSNQKTVATTTCGLKHNLAGVKA